MAIIRKMRTSRYWIAQFNVKTPDGWKSKCRTTRIPIEEVGRSARDLMKEAQAVADSYEYVAKKPLQARKIRNVIESLATIHGLSVETPTAKDWFTERLAAAKRRVSPNTLRSYDDATNKFSRFLGDRFEEGLISEFVPLDFERLKEWFMSLNYSHMTVNKSLTFIYSVFRDALKMNLIDFDPTVAVGYVVPSQEQRDKMIVRKPFTAEQLSQVLEACNPEWRSMVLCSLYLGGQRLGDIATLQWESFDLTKGVVHFRTQKTRHLVYMPLHPCLLAMLKDRREVVSGEFVHPKAAARFHKHKVVASLSVQFWRVLNKLGFVSRDSKNKSRRQNNEFSFHSIRSTATTMLNAAGVPQSVAQAIVGHNSKDIHEHYMKFSEDVLGGALAKLPEF